MIDLIANQALYDGKRVRVVGYVQFQFEGDVICHSQDSVAIGILGECFWFDYPVSSPLAVEVRERWQPQYALVEGIFDAAYPGHMGMTLGAIRDITRLQQIGDSK